MKPFSPLRRSLLATACVVAAINSHTAAAQEKDNYPSKLVTLVVPFTPGGSNDVIARVVGQRLSQIWQQPVCWRQFKIDHLGVRTFTWTGLCRKSKTHSIFDGAERAK